MIFFEVCKNEIEDKDLNIKNVQLVVHHIIRPRSLH